MNAFRATLFLAGFVVSFAHAEALNPNQLPPHTLWVVHVDMDAAKSSQIVPALWEQMQSRPDVKQAVHKIRATIGLDPIHELRSMTLFGTQYSPDETALVIRGKVDRPRLEALLRTAPGYGTCTVGSRVVYLWTERSLAPKAPTSRVGAFVGKDAIVIAATVQAVTAAADALEAKTPATQPQELELKSPPGTILFVSLSGIAEASNLQIHSPMIRQCDEALLTFGERDGLVQIHSQLRTRTSEVAAQIRTALQSARGVQINANSSSIVATMLEPLKVAGDDKTISLDWSYPAADILKLASSMQSQHEAATQPGTKQ